MRDQHQKHRVDHEHQKRNGQVDHGHTYNEHQGIDIEAHQRLFIGTVVRLLPEVQNKRGHLPGSNGQAQRQ